MRTLFFPSALTSSPAHPWPWRQALAFPLTLLPTTNNVYHFILFVSTMKRVTVRSPGRRFKIMETEFFIPANIEETIVRDTLSRKWYGIQAQRVLECWRFNTSSSNVITNILMLTYVLIDYPGYNWSNNSINFALRNEFLVKLYCSLDQKNTPRAINRYCDMNIQLENRKLRMCSSSE